MLYEAKQGTKTYEYIKGIVEAELQERVNYKKRIVEAIGSDFDKDINVDAKDYVGEDKGKKSYIPIYDGDVMLCYVSKPKWWSSDCENSGLYLCRDGVYYRLIYTPGKGYIRHGEPDTDEAFELDIEENAFSSYVMTLSQKWYKLGNIQAGIGFLIEKPEDKKE